MKHTISILAAAAVLGSAQSALAQTEIEFWHAFTGRLGELVAEQVETFNASQDAYQVVASHKGNYSETLNAGIAAFRAGEQPDILMVFEVGTATMMGAKGAIKPVYEVMADAGADFDQSKYIGSVKGYYTTPDGDMLSLPFNSSTPVLWVNRDKLEEAGIDPDTDLSTWEQVGAVLDQLKEAGVDCPMTTAWQSWIHLENFSAYHDVPFATKDNGFGGTDTELAFNGAAQVAHISAMGDWARDGKFIYAGRRNEGGANFRAGECALFTESSAGYAGIKAEAEFDFEVRPLPYWESVTDEPQNTIIGGASLWVMEGQTEEEYKGVAAFLNFLSSPEIQAKWHQDTGYLPITSEAGELTRSQGFYDENPGTDIAVTQMTAKQPTANSKGLRLGSFDQIRGIIDEELEAVWSGDKDAQAALDSAVERGNALLRRFEQASR
ncbi:MULTISPECIES: sn-glycerol-3-phosphate ABC transporter substrate-binding protein UgpB [Marinovum]|jgi:sn-glycerol 3-phosphate transport system substrate-binding protein|uniref:sn-glycerol-3-phosphate-binding periplasmic protein UgpB n=1 Tax=Marinovum algicola TaxID=42444 RepID=A0A975WDA7_9RHOB|nr:MULTISPECIES: sn-glycerol-3-phosphate ABC transporter substrate-binding protein UgpB [Marinovum]MDD9740948.1 sn-glycerol-3-phosphate ABC transporter substrate-binding protein UgpB [Marinovum sp. SP66]MDD9745933.1 sn-glycerol-3-phosphate ABC transporter substrate-binding protein UgpB [Marinovum sp. PR37]SEJ99739.1 carbohydrate ABC transporter substrate-binding protein, CUT1 family [Marinovum algicola]SLN73431.1 sn-glycerol-3-phosphate-binding periplasmic protein UgpB precursor [Marinovum algi